MTAKKQNPVSSVSEKSNRLYRSERDRVIGGVCGGLGRFFNIDSTLVRLIFVLLFVFGGSGFLLYLILWIVIPTESSVNELTEESIKRNVDEIKNKAENFTGKIKENAAKNDSRKLFAYIVIVLGVMILFSNFGWFGFMHFGKLWPLILVIVGIAILARRDRE